MPHIALPEGFPGITGGFAFRPEPAKPMRELAETLLRGPSTLTSGEREMIATFVSPGTSVISVSSVTAPRPRITSMGTTNWSTR